MPPRRPKTPFFEDFSTILEDLGKFFGSKLTLTTDQKSISTLKTKNQLNASRLAFSWLYVLEVDIKNHKKSIKNQSQNAIQDGMPQFCYKLLENQAQVAPKTAQDAPRGAKRRSKAPQDTSRTPQDAAKTPPKTSPDPLKNRYFHAKTP